MTDVDRPTPTPGQTVGPFYGYALPFVGDNVLVPSGRGDAVRLCGHVLDGHGHPVPDALVEIWQSDPSGGVPHEPGSLHRDGFTFTGWGRCSTDNSGGYTFSTLLPGAVDGALAYWSVCVFARGLLDRLFTRAYLPSPRTAEDAFLSTVPAARRPTLMACPEPSGYRFDIRLQGDRETVFLRFPQD